MKPIIELDGYTIERLYYKSLGDLPEEADEKSGEMKRKVSIGLTEDKKNAVVVLKIELQDEKTNKGIELDIVGNYTINEDLTIEEIEDVLKVNGLALIYPYARSIISMITSLDSENAIILPVINTKIYDSKSQKKE